MWNEILFKLQEDDLSFSFRRIAGFFVRLLEASAFTHDDLRWQNPRRRLNMIAVLLLVICFQLWIKRALMLGT